MTVQKFMFILWFEIKVVIPPVSVWDSARGGPTESNGVGYKTIIWVRLFLQDTTRKMFLFMRNREGKGRGTREQFPKASKKTCTILKGIHFHIT